MSNPVPAGTELHGDAQVSSLIRNGASRTTYRLILALQDVTVPLGGALAALIGRAASGTATLIAGTATVTDSKVTANTRFRLGHGTPGANAGALFISALTPGTGFTIKSTNAADTQVAYYEVISY